MYVHQIVIHAMVHPLLLLEHIFISLGILRALPPSHMFMCYMCMYVYVCMVLIEALIHRRNLLLLLNAMISLKVCHNMHSVTLTHSWRENASNNANLCSVLLLCDTYDIAVSLCTDEWCSMASCPAERSGNVRVMRLGEHCIGIINGRKILSDIDGSSNDGPGYMYDILVYNTITNDFSILPFRFPFTVNALANTIISCDTGTHRVAFPYAKQCCYQPVIYIFVLGGQTYRYIGTLVAMGVLTASGGNTDKDAIPVASIDINNRLGDQGVANDFFAPLWTIHDSIPYDSQFTDLPNIQFFRFFTA
jgi:hypothetical protein